MLQTAVRQLRNPTRLLLIALGGAAAGLIYAFLIVGSPNFDTGSMGAGQDARAYWHAVRTGMPYGPDAGTYGAYLYSPVFIELLGPILALPWQQFLAIWTAASMAALLLLTGPVLFIFALPIAFFELWGGNIHLLLAMAIVAGFRWPAAWSFVLLTKITPGVGLLWFAARREWRALAVATGVTAVLVSLSWLADPRLWSAWLDLLVRHAGRTESPPGSIAIHIALRLPVAATVVWYAARTDRRWLVPVGALLAMPVLWWGSLSILIASVALERRRLEAAAHALVERVAPRPRTARPARRWATEPEA